MSKFGIRLTDADGAVSYVRSTRHNRPDYTDDITELAAFAQLQNAVDAIKSLRKDGREPEGGTFDAIEVVFAVVQATEVPRPAKKTGWVIVAKHRYNQPVDGEDYFFHGTKKPGWHDNHLHDFFDNIEKATVFASEAAARVRAEAVLASVRARVTEEETTEVRHHYRDTEHMKAQNVKNKEATVARYRAIQRLIEAYRVVELT